jgi:hypothetical protein
MILVDKFLLPADADDAQRQTIVHQRMRKCRGISGRVVAVARGEAGWMPQTGSEDGVIYFGVIERQCSPSPPRQNQRRKSW